MRIVFLLLSLTNLGLLSLYLTAKYWNWDFDDGFIVYRYVENLLQGNGWVYNLAENYNASTSVLNTLLIAAISRAGISIPHAAHVLGGASLFLAGASLFLVFYSHKRYFLGFFGASLLVWLLGNNLSWGLETNLFIALLFLFALLESLAIETGYLLGLIILARPDGVVLLGLKSLSTIYLKRKIPWGEILRASAVVVPWVLFSIYAFGQIFPATLSQKVWQGSSGYWGQGPIYLKGIAHYLLGQYYVGAVGELLAPFVFIVPLVLSLQGAVILFFERSAFRLIWVSIAIQQLVYVGLNVPPYHWYYGSLGALVYLSGIYGIKVILDLAPLQTIVLRLFATLFSIVAAIVLTGVSYLAFRSAETTALDQRSVAYQLVSDEILRITSPQAKIAAAEVGVVGYLTKRPMVDLVGLSTPYGEFVTPKNLDRLFEEQRPEIFILHVPLMPHEQSVWSDPRFHQNYEVARSIHHPAYQELVIYRRRPGAIEQIYAKNIGLELQRVNDLNKAATGSYQTAGIDPWLDYRAAEEVSSSDIGIAIDVETSGFPAEANRYFPARIFFSSRQQGYAPERSVPILLEKNTRRQYRFPLRLIGQNAAFVCGSVRFDVFENTTNSWQLSATVHSISLLAN